MSMTRNIEKVRAARRRWYAKNKKHAKLKVIERKSEIRKWWADFKSKRKCIDCGECHPSCLEFHHTNDDKESDLCTAVSNGWSKQRIIKEVAKCDCVCANCHRKRHWNESKKKIRLYKHLII